MSGIEAAGLVLALWPAVNGLIRAYKATRGGENLTRIQKQLDIHQTVYQSFLNRLLLGDEYLTEEERNALLRPSDGSDKTLWRDSGVQQRLRQRFGTETFNCIDNVLKDIWRNMDIMKSKLESGQVQATTISGRFKTMARHVQANSPGSDFQIAFQDLGVNVDNLSKLVHSTENSLCIPRSGRPSNILRSRRPSRIQGRKHMVIEQLNDFYHAVVKGFSQCNCSFGHETNFRVQDDLFHTLFGYDEKGSDDSDDSDDLAIARISTLDTTATKLESPITISDTVVSTGMSNRDDSLLYSQSPTSWTNQTRSRGNSTASSQQLRRTIEMQFREGFSRVPSGPDLSLCPLLRSMNSKPSGSRHTQEIIGTLRQGDKAFLARQSGNNDSLPQVCVSCLDDHLLQPGEWRLQKRVDVAQQLALSIIQFNSTYWMDRAWTWRNFCIREDSHGVELYVMRRISPDQREKSPSARPARFWTYIKEPLLVRLGFGLIELGLGKRLAQLRADGYSSEDMRGDDVSEDEKDYDTAWKIVDARILRSEISCAYQAVVEACIACEVVKDNGTVVLRAGDNTFHEDMERYVVQPLCEYFEASWGSD